LTFSSSPPPPLPFHHSAFGSPIPVVSSTTPCPPCVCGFCCLRGRCLLPTLQILYQLHFQFVAKIRFLFFVFCVFFLLGFNKIYSFFLFSKLHHGMSLGRDFGVWQMMVQYLLFFWREILENHDVL
jgi:hypothetical protein